MFSKLCCKIIFSWTANVGLSRKYFWIGTDTFPTNPEPELLHITLGAIRLEPYADPSSDELSRFKNWVNTLSLEELPSHPWSEQLVRLNLLSQTIRHHTNTFERLQTAARAALVIQYQVTYYLTKFTATHTLKSFNSIVF